MGELIANMAVQRRDHIICREERGGRGGQICISLLEERLVAGWRLLDGGQNPHPPPPLYHQQLEYAHRARPARHTNCHYCACVAILRSLHPAPLPPVLQAGWPLEGV